MQKEIWKDVVGYEGRYMVSNLGNVKSVIFKKNGKEKNLKLLDGKDYLQVRLRKDGKGKTLKVHRIVAKAFLDNPNNYNVVNHKNWNKHDNRAENLEWCSYSYNNWYLPNRKEPMPMPKAKAKKENGYKNGNKSFAKPKQVICLETGDVFASISEAARNTNVEQSNISRCLRGRQRTCGGYHWKYANEETKLVGTLTLADGNITGWIDAEKKTDGTYKTCYFDLSDLRNYRGRIQFVIKDIEDSNKQICIYAAG